MPPTRISTKDVRDDDLTDVDFDAANKDGLPVVPSLRTLGTGSQQAAAGDDIRLGFADSYHRHSQLSVAHSPRFYVCGQVRASGGTPTNVVALDTIFLMPFRAPHAFTLMAAGVANTNAPVGCTFNMGVYDSIGPQDLHPNNLIVQLGVATLNAFPAPFTITGLSIVLAPNTVYWLAVVFSGVAPICRTLNTGSAEPILGHPSGFAGNGGIGYQVPAFPAAPLPDPVLPASTSIITSNGTPFLMYGV